MEASFERRQQLLDDLLQADYAKAFQFANHKRKEYWYRQIVEPQDGMYVMRVANKTSVTITDENLKNNAYWDYRNCLVIIDNHPGIQRIAIEKRSRAFSNTQIVAHILEASFSKLLLQSHLKVTLSAVYSSEAFWNTCNNHPEGFSRVVFCFSQLNLERLTRVLDRYLVQAREDWNSALDFAFRANEGGIVSIDPQNERQQALVQGASAAGAQVKMYPRGSRTPILCGKGHYVERELSDEVIRSLESKEQTLPGVGDSPMDDIKCFTKNLPNIF
ncbi:MAG: hypothetical protein ACI4C3_03780 [Bacteroides sp.]